MHYDTGISQVEGFRKTWASLQPYVSTDIFNEVTGKLEIQYNDALWWRDACVGYFQTFSGKALPSGVRPLDMPIDSVMTKSMLSKRNGMPTHDENNKPVLVPNRRFVPGGTMSSGGPVAPVKK